MDARVFVDNSASFEDIVCKIAELAGEHSESTTNDLAEFLLVKTGSTYEKAAIPALACRGFLSRGPIGVSILSGLIEKAEGAILPGAIVESLWYAAHGAVVPISGVSEAALPAVLQNNLKPDTEAAAEKAFRDFVIQAQNNEDLFDVLIRFMNINSLRSLLGPLEVGTLRREVFQVFAEASIKISKTLLETFERIISQTLREEEYQSFLVCNPVLLDPLASKVIPKQSLGLEFKTDFVIQRLDNEYIVVEIEKPQDSIFTKADDFSSGFTHAYGQVIDFLEWVDAHSEYARHHMPGISSPKGLLVMGMRKTLTPMQTSKLKRFCIVNRHIEVLTYDDLLQRGVALYNNIHRTAVDSQASQ